MGFSERIDTILKTWLGSGMFQRQSWAGETFERRDGAHMGFSERLDTILKTWLDSGTVSKAKLGRGNV